MNSLKKVFSILPSSKIRSAAFQVALMFVAMIFEFVGLGLLVPILYLLAGDSNSYLIDFTNFIFNGSSTQHEQILVAVLLFVGVNLLKMLFLIFQTWSQSKFIFDVKKGLAQTLLQKYINEPYIFHVQQNSAHLIRNLTTVVGQFVDGLSSVFILITDLFLLIGALVLLFFLYPNITLYAILIISVTLWLFQRLTKKRITKFGADFHLSEGLRLKHLQQILGGIKEIKVFGRESFFFNEFVYYNELAAHSGEKQRIATALPRTFLEMFSVVLVSSLLLIMFARGMSSTSILSAIGILVSATFRLLPSIYRISGAIQNLNYLMPSIDQLKEELKLGETANVGSPDVEISLSKNIELKNIKFSYNDTNGPVLKDISLSISANSSVGFVGTTGAGKSTLVELILGLIVPDSGQVLVDGKAIQTNIRGWQKQIGYVPQQIYLSDDTIRRNIAFGIPEEEINNEAVMLAIKAAHLDHLIRDIPEGIETEVGERGVRLSGGQRQRIGIARALYHNPSLLVFDEATSALDNITEAEVMKSIDMLKGSRTILIIAHRLTSLRNTDYVYCLDKGRILEEGPPEKVLNNPGLNNLPELINDK